MQTDFRFSLPDFTRIVWRTREEKAWWLAKLERISKAWLQIERTSVFRGLRAAALQDVVPADLPDLTRVAARRGVSVLPVSQGPQHDTYATVSAPMDPSKPWIYRTALCQADLANDLLTALETKDNTRIGQLLGFPTCCLEAYNRTWGAGQVDSTWEAGQAGVDGPPEANIFLRWLGVRLVPHMPCSFTCLASVEFGQQFAELGRSLGYGAEVDDLYEFLSWPVAWTRRHGIAELTLPATKIATRSDYTPGLQSLTRAGIYTDVDSTLWLNNGFQDPGYMLHCHDVLGRVCKTLLPPGACVLDLGAGNGRLLTELRTRHGFIPMGVEHIGSIVPVSVLNWFRGDIADTPVEMIDAADAILLMPGRLLEGPAEQQDRLRALCLRVKTLIVYAYADNLARANGSLIELTTQAGLPAPSIVRQDKGIEVGVIRVTE